MVPADSSLPPAAEPEAPANVVLVEKLGCDPHTMARWRLREAEVWAPEKPVPTPIAAGPGNSRGDASTDSWL